MITSARGLMALLRLPYWMMTGGLALLTSFAIAKGSLDLLIIPVDFLFDGFRNISWFCLERLF